ncbi:hypothetical protein AA0113_g11550 [Alternaria arborescens]|uniref:Cytochrome P450 monooxygenase n=1 Tax=Alternaria arborescens TaxID=156630 RepID=A0A4Q4Q6K4_9PLEO|nr:hypothetical protein AA0111_g11389 [Alternaria arborescens]RYO16536.1 hypothetical protein AA0111_g11389 [Alternaria arborescens]RYO35216.1 hypothetical protein AA0113_g11550 [Alternaria arborescens]
MSIPGPSRIPHVPPEPSLDALVQSLPAMVTISLGVMVVLSIVVMTSGKSKPPLANPPRWYQTALFKRLEFQQNGRAIMSEARRRYGKQLYRLITDTGECLILPPEYAATIRNSMDLSFAEAVVRMFSGHVHGFEMFAVLLHEKRLVQTVVMNQLTKYLNTLTKPLSEEATYACDVIFGKDPEWKETVIADSILQLTARLSTRIFLGDTMCRNEAWLSASKAYTATCFIMTLKMAALPPYLKFLVPYLSSEAKTVRENGNRCREILTPLFTQRQALKEEARRNGQPEPVFNDIIDWYEQEAWGTKYDPALFQTALSFVAIHTTSELLTHALTLLASEPKYVDALREEIVRVLSSEGLTKGALANLKLMNSCLKEAQRYRPAAYLTMRRKAKRTVVLPDGTIIPQGQQIAVDGYHMSDPAIHPNPDKFDIYRYYRVRDDPNPTKVSQAHLLSTGPDNLSFSHGVQGCPGRFFAANEMKIALYHLLLKYDWELGEDCDLSSKILFGETEALDTGNQLRFRRRKGVEIDLEGLVHV